MMEQDDTGIEQKPGSAYKELERRLDVELSHNSGHVCMVITAAEVKRLKEELGRNILDEVDFGIRGRLSPTDTTMDGSLELFHHPAYIGSVFFDIGGVLALSLLRKIYESFEKAGRHLPKDRFHALMCDERLLTGPAGTLEHLLQTEFKDIGISADDVIAILQTGVAPQENYKQTWEIARELRGKGKNVGIISDTFAEAAAMVRLSPMYLHHFYPIILSPEVGFSKRSPKIFDTAKEKIGINAGGFLMVEDNPDVLVPARQAGWYGLLFTSAPSLRRNLQRYGILRNTGY